jgi:hypothetical protein
MAKALLGYVGGPDTRLLAEVAVLRRRIRDLEAEVLRLAAENDARLAVDTPLADEIIALDAAREPVTANAHALA